MCGVWYAAVFFAYLWVSFFSIFFLDLDWLNTSFKCCSVCKVSEKVAKNDIAWCHILTILVEAMSPCDLLLGAVSNRCIFGGCGSQTTGGTLKGLNMRMLGKRLVEDEIDKIKPYRFKPYVWCFGVHNMYSEVYIPWIMTSCGGNGGKGDDFPPKVNGQIRGTPNPRRSMVRFPQEGPFLSPVVHQFFSGDRDTRTTKNVWKLLWNQFWYDSYSNWKRRQALQVYLLCDLPRNTFVDFGMPRDMN